VEDGGNKRFGMCSFFRVHIYTAFRGTQVLKNLSFSIQFVKALNFCYGVASA
jgi:hypothetical protein